MCEKSHPQCRQCSVQLKLYTIPIIHHTIGILTILHLYICVAKSNVIFLRPGAIMSHSNPFFILTCYPAVYKQKLFYA